MVERQIKHEVCMLKDLCINKIFPITEKQSSKAWDKGYNGKNINEKNDK